MCILMSFNNARILRIICNSKIGLYKSTELNSGDKQQTDIGYYVFDCTSHLQEIQHPYKPYDKDDKYSERKNLFKT